MSTFVFANNVNTTLAAPITTVGQTTIVLASSANFPTIPPGDYWVLTLNDALTGNVYEILWVTGIVGTTLTVIRGQEGTAATTWLVGDYAYAADTAAILTQLQSGSSSNPFAVSTLTASGAVIAGTGVQVNGPLTLATTGTFSAAVTSYAGFIATALGSYSTISGTYNGALIGQTSVSTGAWYLGGASSSVQGDWNVTNAGVFTINKPLAVVGNIESNAVIGAGAISATATAVGGLSTAYSATIGFVYFGSGSNWWLLDAGQTNTSGFSFRSAANTGYAPVFGGAYTNSSDATLKKNVRPITNALATIAQLAPSDYDWIIDNQPDMGFIAQAVEPVLPQLVRTDAEGMRGIVYTGIAALNTAAIQEIVAILHTAGVAGF